ncbi:AI-2E family transporter [Bacillus ginsengihumi]|uniref:AI-2E family transporter n=1 Tax=Heyndrickxia ginsengihumi TaxID=363870 RepID=A0A0A6VGY1_9BACI|nr:AI-2E family transporter [Heyndrickxia ginsengihumi]KHD86831.1 membrane protein [Heyndrickxia ginsengihumi]MBE6183699.1 AI-2E family transporter [Bacillus sp. (in: firmicutes)]NEY19758.1 AI-2E family transporter [Heyndrickxia ginsengihumi]
MNKPNGQWIYKLGFLLFILVILYVVLLLKPLWWPILHILLIACIPLLIGAFIAYLLHPVVEFLHKRGFHRGIAIIVIYLLFFGGIAYGVYRGFPLMIEQMTDLSEHIPEFADHYRDGVTYLQTSTKHWPDGLQDQIDERVELFELWLTRTVSNSINTLMKFINFILALAVIPFISFYLLKDFQKVKRTAWSLTPKKWRRPALKFFRDLDHSLGGYIRGLLLDCTFISVISMLAFWLLHIRYPILLGLIMGVTNVIPYFGPIIGAIPVSIIAATISLKTVLFVLIVIFGLEFIEGNILSPLIFGKSLHLHPLFIIIALIFGEEVGGVVGMILSVPTLVILKVVIIHAHHHFMRMKRIKQVDKLD